MSTVLDMQRCTPDAPKRGRKPLPPESRKDARVELRVHPDIKADWQAKADNAGMSLSAWIVAKIKSRR